MGDSQTAKRAVGIAAAQLVESGMVVGVGTGSTAKYFTEALAQRVSAEGLVLRCVPTSRQSRALAEQFGLPMVPLTSATRPDLTIDGADEFDPALNLVKGGGGALVQEKLVAVSSREMIVIADESKSVKCLGAFPLPVAVVPFGWETTRERLKDRFGVAATLRESPGGHGAFVTDDGLFVLDLRFGQIPDPAQLERELRTVTGVAEVGLFIAVAVRVLLGEADGTVREVTRSI
ncbi:MAG: ribose-5-phosphate isomerase RpiA [Armatimonadetes bacterium]|nr:ribose-5-phosphate isomerase RpiA [Armatimonadota bacterium]